MENIHSQGHDFVFNQSTKPTVINYSVRGVMTDPSENLVTVECGGCEDLHTFSREEVLTGARNGNVEMGKIACRLTKPFGVTEQHIERDLNASSVLKELDTIMSQADTGV